jgi:hypothetical protein
MNADYDDSAGRDHHHGVLRWYGIALIAMAVLAWAWWAT